MNDNIRYDPVSSLYAGNNGKPFPKFTVYVPIMPFKASAELMIKLICEDSFLETQAVMRKLDRKVFGGDLHECALDVGDELFFV